MTPTRIRSNPPWTTTVVLAMFLFVLGVSLFYMPAAMGGEHTNGCPFMAHEEMLCGMGALEHLSVWQSAFTAIVPALLLVMVAGALIIARLLHLPPPRWTRVLHTRAPSKARLHRLRPVPFRPLQELFAAGLLHPKCF